MCSRYSNFQTSAIRWNSVGSPSIAVSAAEPFAELLLPQAAVPSRTNADRERRNKMCGIRELFTGLVSYGSGRSQPQCFMTADSCLRAYRYWHCYWRLVPIVT